jgi:hypothetical protein
MVINGGDAGPLRRGEVTAIAMKFDEDAVVTRCVGAGAW